MSGEAFADLQLSDEWQWFSPFAQASQLVFVDPPTSKYLFYESLKKATCPEHRLFVLQELSSLYQYILDDNLPPDIAEEYHVCLTEAKGESRWGALVDLLVSQPLLLGDNQVEPLVKEFLDYLFVHQNLHILSLNHVYLAAPVLCGIEFRLWNCSHDWQLDRFSLAIETLCFASLLCTDEWSILDREVTGTIPRAVCILREHLGEPWQLQLSPNLSRRFQGTKDLDIALILGMRLATRLTSNKLLGTLYPLAILLDTGQNTKRAMCIDNCNREEIAAHLLHMCQVQFSLGSKPDNLQRVLTYAQDAAKRSGENRMTSSHLLYGCLQSLDKESVKELRRLGLQW